MIFPKFHPCITRHFLVLLLLYHLAHRLDYSAVSEMRLHAHTHETVTAAYLQNGGELAGALVELFVVVLESRLVLLDDARLIVHASLVAAHILLHGGQMNRAPVDTGDIC